MWYRVYKYPNHLYSASEILKFSLAPTDWVKVNGVDKWYFFSDPYIQNLLAKDLGYSIGDDGVIHRTVSQPQSPENLGYAIGDDGVLHKTSSLPQQQYQPTKEIGDSSSRDNNCLGIIAALLIPIVVLFFLEGVAERIYFDTFPLKPGDTIEDVNIGKMASLVALSTSYMYFIECFVKSIESAGVVFVPLCAGLVLGFAYTFMHINFSIVFAILYVISLGSMIYSGYCTATK